jgi:hypothetical protein
VTQGVQGFYILSTQRARDGAAKVCQTAGPDTIVRFMGNKRSLEQNSKMWAMLSDIARQVEWPVDGETQKLRKEDWKIILTAGAKKQRVAPGVDGGFVVLGEPTSSMTVAEMREMIDLCQHFGDSKGVKWSDPKEWHDAG